MASDGLWDNMSNSDIMEQLLQAMNSTFPEASIIDGESFESFDSDSEDIKQMCRSLAHCAYDNSFYEDFESPFEMQARQVGRTHKGGKEDDISVIMAKIQFGK